jgi:hypothetical protein
MNVSTVAISAEDWFDASIFSSKHFENRPQGHNLPQRSRFAPAQGNFKFYSNVLDVVVGSFKFQNGWQSQALLFASSNS